ncbi:helix-turn-helix domain-containing protein [Amycolatopsis sp.]|uniref:helix-turn-helix domain-containing protein n=1 Tax=Amycolatopsis sp. TaxID=37632 RepID=UPI0039C857C9
MPRFQLLRAFRRETGLTPHGYLRQLRLRHAQQLLSAGHTVATPPRKAVSTTRPTCTATSGGPSPPHQDDSPAASGAARHAPPTGPRPARSAPDGRSTS